MNDIINNTMDNNRIRTKINPRYHHKNQNEEELWMILMSCRSLTNPIDY